MQRRTSSEKYPPALRSFALTLAFYSPKAYKFVRSTFHNCLPHLASISKWYKSVNGAPGFSKEALLALKMKRDEAVTKNRELLCNLVIDEMAIREQVEWTGNKFTGYVDVGTHIDSDELPKAKEALVFMLVCLNDAWKIPIAYFLIDGITGSQKAQLVIKCLEFIQESGVTVTSLTFDGLPANFTMASELGANLKNPNNLKTMFQHPVTGDDIFIFLDPCHMLKLVRNCFGTKRMLIDKDKREINWEYVTKLVEKQNVEGLHAATKVRMRHLQWTREKMKVRLAAQTFSRSVSDALLYLCNDLQDVEFAHAEATAQFILKINNLFDIMNSRNVLSKYMYKKPFSPATASHFNDYLNEVKEYLLNLKLQDGILVTNSNRKVGFVGFLVCIESLQKMYETYVTNKMKLKYLLTYKLSQDHLEIFFGAVRSKGGFNNNPTARQFEAAYKRLIVHNEISGPETGNAIDFDRISILSCNFNAITQNENGEDLQHNEECKSIETEIQKKIEVNGFLTSPAWDLTLYVQDIVSYIAGFVVKILKKCVNCQKCLQLLESVETYSDLQKRKKYGALVNASEFVVVVCKVAEKYFRFFNKTTNIFNKNVKNPSIILVKNSFDLIPTFCLDFFEDHLYDSEPVDGHYSNLVKLILERYFKIRLHYETVKQLDSRKERVRSINTKTILFRHE